MTAKFFTYHLVAVLFAGLAEFAPQACGQAYDWKIFAGANGGPGDRDGDGSDARFSGPYGIAVDHSGNLYVADRNNCTIRKITSAGRVSTLAGTPGLAGSADGRGSAARFNGPRDVAVDRAGNVYVADTQNRTIRKITSTGIVTTLAGLAGKKGSFDGQGSAAQFFWPTGLAVDGAGNVVVADQQNHTVRKITSDGRVTTLAGKAEMIGSVDDYGAAARFQYPTDVTVDARGNVFVADRTNQTIRKIDSSGLVSTVAGKEGTIGYKEGKPGLFTYPGSLAVDAEGSLYVAEPEGGTVRKISSAGVASTVAGKHSTSGSADGPVDHARFASPRGIAVGDDGVVYIADSGNQTIRKITDATTVTTLAGLAGGDEDGTGLAARFRGPGGVAIDARNGDAYVADTNNSTIRRITPAGEVSTFAGSPGSVGATDGTRDVARFRNPSALTLDGSGNVYVADTGNFIIRKITSDGVVSTLAGVAGIYGSGDDSDYGALFYLPQGIALDASGNVYVADSGNVTIRKIATNGTVTTLAGKAGSDGSTNGKGGVARFLNPRGLAVDPSGNVYVADSASVRKISSDGMVSTLVGNAESFGVSADGLGSSARFSNAVGLALDGSGNLFVADGFAVRKVSPAGVVTTVGGSASYSGNLEGLGSHASLAPGSIAVTMSGRLYVTSVNSVLTGTPVANILPVATNDSAGLRGKARTEIAVLNNDTDAEGYRLTVAAVTQGVFGQVELKDGVVSYTAGNSFPGQDSFQYTIDDEEGGSAMAMVTVFNPFMVPMGTYMTPLLDGTTHLPSGSWTAKLAADGCVTGSVVFGGKSYLLKGLADFAGEFNQTIIRKNLPALTVTIHFSGTDFGQAVISATDATTTISGTAAENSVAPLQGTTTGSYTLSLPFAGNGTTTPASTGYAMASLSKSGAAKFVGKFPDGSAFSIAAQLQADGRVVFNLPLYGKPKGYAYGDLLFHNGTVVDGTIALHKPPQAKPGKQLYPGGFDLSIATAGESFLPPDAGRSALHGGSLPVDYQFTAALNPPAPAFAVVLSIDGADKPSAIPLPGGLTFKFNRKSGLVTGSFLDPATGAKRTLNGAIRQPTHSAEGLFLDATGARSFSLQMAPP